ncbi:hypothetical protein [Rhizobium leguminosarum]|uniref:Uncharacterized protein n=1 Tax=Rhizobium leguminosarum TaxID=384 RepID=A0A7K3VJA5_RHILE|nr:hypothetical protein [Rhizobium leguminosarum]NEK17215.1 hypothetical protein [Rhizobium leguminosarum]NEK37323.1 hypothetical protein [Rhizobium leguminosarum]
MSRLSFEAAPVVARHFSGTGSTAKADERLKASLFAEPSSASQLLKAGKNHAPVIGDV